MTLSRFIRKFYKSKKAKKFIAFVSETWFFYLRNEILKRTLEDFNKFINRETKCFTKKFESQMLEFISLNPSLIDDSLQF